MKSCIVFLLAVLMVLFVGCSQNNGEQNKKSYISIKNSSITKVDTATKSDNLQSSKSTDEQPQDSGETETGQDLTPDEQSKYDGWGTDWLL